MERRKESVYIGVGIVGRMQKREEGKDKAKVRRGGHNKEGGRMHRRYMEGERHTTIEAVNR